MRTKNPVQKILMLNFLVCDEHGVVLKSKMATS